MPDYGVVECKHSLGYRFLVVAQFLFGLTMSIGVAAQLWHTLVSYGQGDPEYVGVCLVFRLIVFAGLGAPFAAWLLWNALHHSFMLQAYWLQGSDLRVQSPVLHRQRSISLGDVVAIRPITFFPFSNSPENAYTSVLIAEDGTKIKLSIDLPIWPEVVSRCRNVHDRIGQGA